MPIDLTDAQRRELDARRSSDAVLVLLEIRHPDLATPLRIVKNSEDVTAAGVLYRKGWFDLSLPNDDDEPRRGQISVPNIDRALSSILLAITSPPRCKFTEVLASDPDTALAVYDFLFLRSVQIDAETVSGSLEPWSADDTEPAFARLGTQDRFPGLYL